MISCGALGSSRNVSGMISCGALGSFRNVSRFISSSWALGEGSTLSLLLNASTSNRADCCTFSLLFMAVTPTRARVLTPTEMFNRRVVAANGDQHHAQLTGQKAIDKMAPTAVATTRQKKMGRTIVPKSFSGSVIIRRRYTHVAARSRDRNMQVSIFRRL
jgi:hypothetical protein